MSSSITAETVFVYAEGHREKVPAHIAGPELLRLARGRGLEGIPADEIVEAARPLDAPLHDEFEWDDKRAGEEHRREQARLLIRNLRIIVKTEDGDDRQCRVFVNLRDGGGYRRVVEVERDETSRERLLKLALGDVRSAKTRLAEIRGFSEIVRKLAAIERAILHLK